MPQIEGCSLLWRRGFGVDVGLCVFVCGQGTWAWRSIVMPVLFWPEGRKLWKWGVERRSKTRCCNTESEGDRRLVSSLAGCGSLHPRLIFVVIILSEEETFVCQF